SAQAARGRRAVRPGLGPGSGSELSVWWRPPVAGGHPSPLRAGAVARGVGRQTQIYLGGVSGLRPRVPVDVARLEVKAAETMAPEAFAYVAAGAGAERTLRANRAAFHRW